MAVTDDYVKQRQRQGVATAFVVGGFPMTLAEVTVAASRFPSIPVSAGTIAPLLTVGAIGALWNPPGDARLLRRDTIDPAESEQIKMEGGLQTVTVTGQRPPPAPPAIGVTSSSGGALPDWTRILEGKYSPDMWDRLARFGITRQLLRQLKNKLVKRLPRIGKTLERLLRESRSDATASAPRSVSVSAESPSEYVLGTSAELSEVASPVELVGNSLLPGRQATARASAPAANRLASSRTGLQRAIAPALRPAIAPALRPALRPALSRLPSYIMKAQPQLAQFAQTTPPPAKTASCDCPSEKPKKQEKKKRKPRTVCYRGTFVERSKTLSKTRKEIVPCL